MQSLPRVLARLSICVLSLFLTTLTVWAQKPSTAGSALSDALEQELIKEINLARTRPAEYAAHLEQLRSYFSGKEYRQPGRPAVLTEEGVAALEDAIKFLRSSKPLPPLEIARGLCEGARVLVADQSVSGATGHRGADGSFCEQRAQRFGAWQGDIGENLTYGPETARERVLTLLIDDGFANRGHRMRIFSPGYKVIGVACGDHKLGSMCVINFAGGFTDSRNIAQPASRPNDKSAPKLPAGARRF